MPNEKQEGKKRKNTPGMWSSSNKKNQAMRRTRKRKGTLVADVPNKRTVIISQE